MALPATVRRFTVSLADSDRGVYEQLDWRVAQHPSESERYLVARVIARALEHGDGVEFSRGGVSDDDEPAIVQRDGEVALRALPVGLLDGVVATLDRVNRWDLSVTGGVLYLAVGAAQFEGAVRPVAIAS